MSRAVVAVAKQENNPTSIGLTQYLDPSYWTWAAKDANGAALAKVGDQGSRGQARGARAAALASRQ